MLDIEIFELINNLKATKTETNKVEVKAAKDGCPKRLYDTISAFSNKSGGVILFGIDENDGYNVCGVYDAGDLQKKVVEQCNQMNPAVRGIFSSLVHNGKIVIAFEVPEAAYEDKPVYYSGAGMMKGSYIRVGDADLKMTDREIYSLMAFKNNIHDELRIVNRAEMIDLDMDKIEEFLKIQISKRPNFAKLGKERMLEELGVIAKFENGNYKPTVSGILCFGIYPQSFFPQWCVTCVAVPGYEIGEIVGVEERFIDNKKIEGTIPEMIEGSISFLLKNMSVRT
ncbi:MAG: AAA family ATPase, partial [Clostridiaceae bacterium]|nr:AAA family ATPase [Clostridiaceae bacterium]